MTSSYIISAVRTPMGSFQGALAPLLAPDLGAGAIREALCRAGVQGDEVDQVIMGCVLTAGLGQAPARQAAIRAGIPETVPAMTINKVCSSGLMAIMLADQLIRLGEADVVVAGGMESMTNAPYLAQGARSGLRLGDAVLKDSMVFDGLWDIHTDQHMGCCAELCAKKYGLTREKQDAYAIRSYERAQRATEQGAFREEIVPVSVPGKRGESLCDADEEPFRLKVEKMRTLKPSFQKEGTITAANASSISDGAAALVVVSEAKAKALQTAWKARILAGSSNAHAPEWFTTAPIGAMQKAMAKARLTPEGIDLFEINEAFSCVPMAAIEEFGLDAERVNPHGGAVALGHPIGASGARIVTTLISALRQAGRSIGMAGICNGGGEATSMILSLEG